ncbi:hypothetical protein AXA74_05285 [Bordetella hinzii LMG 13501]|nr:hypothetical protein AXA74_05285 [Bordetella hinzii LMG 13501]
MDARGSHIVNMEKLALWCSASPDYHLRTIVELGLMETAHQRRYHMTILRMKVIVGPIKISGHHATIVSSILPVIAFT